MSGKTIDGKAGVCLFVDERPGDDQENTSGIKDIPGKVTAKIIEDFSKTRVFKDIHFGSDPDDAFEINGTIKRFKWDLKTNPIAYLPFLDLMMFFGVPMYSIEAVSELSLTVSDRATGESRVYEGFSRVTDSYSLYRFKAGEAGAELAESFRESVKTIKDGMMTGTSVARAEDDGNDEFDIPARRPDGGGGGSGFSLHFHGFNPFYTAKFANRSQVVAGNRGTWTFNGSMTESAPGLVGGFGLRFSPEKRFYLNINYFGPHSQNGTLRESLDLTGFGTDVADYSAVLTQDISYGLNVDYLLFGGRRNKVYVGAGFLRSAFKMELSQGVYNNAYINYTDPSVMKTLYTSINRRVDKKEVDIFLLDVGYEWMMKDTVGLSLFAYLPFTKEPKIDFSGTLNYYEAQKSGSYYYTTVSSYESVSKTVVDLTNPPVVLNMMLSYYFY